MVIDAAVWERQMPASIEAIYSLNGDNRVARDVHAKIVGHFGLSGSDIPLLRLDLKQKKDGNQQQDMKAVGSELAPFSVLNV